MRRPTGDAPQRTAVWTAPDYVDEDRRRTVRAGQVAFQRLHVKGDIIALKIL
jgi:hypothetical protein